MLIDEEKKAIEKGLVVLWIIWAAIMGSLFIYGFICHQLGEEIRRNVNQFSHLSLLRNMPFGVAIIILLLTHYFKKILLGSAFGGFLSKLPKSAPYANQPPFLAKYTKALIVSFALSESIGIFGLVLFFLGDSFRTLYTFIGISALAIIYHRPKREDREKLALAMQRPEKGY